MEALKIANKRLETKKIMQIVHLHRRGYGVRRIAKRVGACKVTVRKYRRIIEEAEKELGL